MKSGPALLIALVVGPAIIWFGMMRPLTLPEQFVMQIACSDYSHLRDRDKIDCWTMLQFNRVFAFSTPPQETCNDPSAHLVGNHRCCGAGFHSNDGGASNACYKD